MTLISVFNIVYFTLNILGVLPSTDPNHTRRASYLIDIDPRAVRRGLMPVVGAGPRTNDQIEEMIRKLCYFFVLKIYIGLKKKLF